MMRKIITSILLILWVSSYTLAGGSGQVVYEYWDGISGAAVADLTSDPDYIADLPDGTNNLYVLEAPRDWLDNYGARINGYIIPSSTGSYTLWICSDDASELYLSTDDNPDNLSVAPIASVTGYCVESPPSWNEFPSQRSSLMTLESGKPYFFRALMKEGGGSDNLAVGWQGPGIPQVVVIPGAYISSYNPYGARNPVPAHRQGSGTTDDVLINDDLSWDAPPPDPNVLNPTYDVYIGTVPDLPQMTKVASGISGTSVDPGTLAYGTRHYWRVQVYDNTLAEPNKVSTGVYWWFETEEEKPVITQQPTDQVEFPGDIATFTVVATSPTPITYAWFKTTDPNNSIGSSSTLEFDPVALADEGEYYCELSNAGGDTVSNTVRLTVKRLLAYWPLDTDVNAFNGIGPDGTIFGTGASDPPSMFSSGMVNNAIGVNLDAEKGEYVVFGAVGITGEMPRTIACWVKNSVPVSEIVDWCNIFGFTSPTAAGEQSFDFNKRGGQTQYCIHRYGAEWNIHEIDGEWHFLAATFENDTVAWYIDGMPGGTAGTNLQTQDIVHLGKRAHSDPLWRGWVDDARVYNYALNPYEVAQLFVDVVPDVWLCPVPPTGDVNGDCIVDLKDLGIVLEEWLRCNRIPDCL